MEAIWGKITHLKFWEHFLCDDVLAAENMDVQGKPSRTSSQLSHLEIKYMKHCGEAHGVGLCYEKKTPSNGILYYREEKIC